jgi:hypothetical protein
MNPSSEVKRQEKPTKSETVEISETLLRSGIHGKQKNQQTTKVRNRNKHKDIRFYKGSKQDYLFLPSDFHPWLIKALGKILVKGEMRRYFDDKEFTSLLALNSAIWKVNT